MNFFFVCENDGFISYIAIANDRNIVLMTGTSLSKGGTII